MDRDSKQLQLDHEQADSNDTPDEQRPVASHRLIRPPIGGSKYNARQTQETSADG
jgi:hypothetical protein